MNGPLAPKKPRPKAPPGPPNRSFRITFFRGSVETKESKQRTRDYENFMKGWKAATGISPVEFRPNPVEYR